MTPTGAAIASPDYTRVRGDRSPPVQWVVVKVIGTCEALALMDNDRVSRTSSGHIRLLLEGDRTAGHCSSSCYKQIRTSSIRLFLINSIEIFALEKSFN